MSTAGSSGISTSGGGGGGGGVGGRVVVVVLVVVLVDVEEVVVVVVLSTGAVVVVVDEVARGAVVSVGPVLGGTAELDAVPWPADASTDVEDVEPLSVGEHAAIRRAKTAAPARWRRQWLFILPN